MAKLKPETLALLNWKWRGWWARPNQLAPQGEWNTWLVLAGRGFGKTRSGSEWIREKWKSGASRMALIAETAADARDVLVEGKSGILATSPKSERPIYEPSKRRLTWPNGAVATIYNGTEPDQLRGPEHEFAWVDELAKYAYPQELWDNLQFGLRIGDKPQVMVTTTPRPIPIIRSIMKDDKTVIVRGSTFDNASNLSPVFLDNVRKKYQGTRIGRQELFAEVLDDIVGALWTRSTVDLAHWRVTPDRSLPPMRRVVVAIDPSGTAGDSDDGDSVGIVVAGLGVDGLGYILADRTCKVSPAQWARIAVDAYHEFKADRIVAERNFGGAMVGAVIRACDPRVPYKEVTASRGKVARAEPIAALYEQGRVRHVAAMNELEDQMTSMTSNGYLGDGSPDRVDALVWALTELMLSDASNYTLEGL